MQPVFFNRASDLIVAEDTRCILIENVILHLSIYTLYVNEHINEQTNVLLPDINGFLCVLCKLFKQWIYIFNHTKNQKHLHWVFFQRATRIVWIRLDYFSSLS